MHRIVNAIPKRAIGWHAFHLTHKVYAASLGFVVDFAPPARAPVGFVCVRRTSGCLTLTIEVSSKCKYSDRMWSIRSSMHAFKCFITPAMFKESLLPKRREGLRHTGIYTRTHARTHFVRLFRVKPGELAIETVGPIAERCQCPDA